MMVGYVLPVNTWLAAAPHLCMSLFHVASETSPRAPKCGSAIIPSLLCAPVKSIEDGLQIFLRSVTKYQERINFSVFDPTSS